MKKIRIETDMENTDRLLRVAKNIDVAVRFFGEKTDTLDKLIDALDVKSNETISNEVADLDTLSKDFNELYELLNNLSEELKEVMDNIIYKGTK
jgi:hypothetical protein